MRKLATIRKIDAINPIEGADAIECAVIGGWHVVIKKGDFKVGDLAVYLEIDSWVPYELAPFLSKSKEPREFNGVKGERLRTVKLRGQLSQGLLLPIDVVGFHSQEIEDEDVSELLNVQKWEAPVNAQLAGQVRGTFPSFIPKTDQERIQNMTKMLPVMYGTHFEITEKLDGSSMTVYNRDGDIGVCSRNMDLKETEGNTFWKVAREQGLIEFILECGNNFALQGELIGPGIQKNRYNLTKPEFRLFDIYDIKAGEYLKPHHRQAVADVHGIKHVPIIAQYRLNSEVDTMDVMIDDADGVSELNPKAYREGLVFKDMEGGVTFKVISNKFLLKGGEE